MSTPRLVRLLVVAAVVPALVLAACLKQNDGVRLEKDGSGSLTQTATIDKGLLEQLKSVAKMMGTSLAPGGPAMDGGSAMGGDDEGGGELDLLIERIFSPDDVKGRVKGVEGLEIKKAESTDKDGKVTSTFEIAFSSLEAAAKAGLFVENSVDLKKNEDGSYTLTFDLGIQIPGPAAPAPAPGTDPGMDGPPKPPPQMGGMDISGLFAILQPIVGGLEVKRSIFVPGTIVETNGEKADAEGGATVTWTKTFKDVASGKKLAQKVTFKGEGLALKPFTYKPDFNDMAKRYLKITGGEEGEGGTEGKEPPAPKEKPPAPVTPNK